MTTHRVRRAGRGALRCLRSPLPWRSTVYLASYLPIGTACCVVTVVVLATAMVLNITWLGVPLLLGAMEIVRGCARLERSRGRLLGHPVAESYRATGGGGLVRQVRARLADPATRRDCGYLSLLYPPLLVLDVVALAIWLVCLAGVALPLWYWAIPNQWHDGPTEYGALIGYLPDGPHGRGFGVWIGSLPSALAASGVFLLVAPLAGALVVAAARVHAAAARALLGPATDPLAAARRVLDQRGPLTT